MDCLTISTFRNLEQQAVQRYKELTARKEIPAISLRETFRQERPCVLKELQYINNSKKSKSTTKGVNYYA